MAVLVPIRRLLSLLVVALFLVPTPADADPALESRLKAAFLFNFAKFVSWPEGSATGAIDICVAGDPALGAVMTAAVAGKQAAGRSVAARDLGEVEAVAGCDILFVAGEDVAGLLSASKAYPVLTVGDGADFLDQGGIINFVRRDNRLAFEISRKAAEERGLQLSSKLLSLAVRTGRGG